MKTPTRSRRPGTPHYPDLTRALITGQAKADEARNLPTTTVACAAQRAAVRQVEQANALYLHRIVATHGWPGRWLVGEEGARAAWKIALAADHDHAFQVTCLRLMREAARTGDAHAAHWATLFDRCCTNREQKQLYGTQHRLVAMMLEPYPIHEPERLDARRAAVGLTPFAERDEARQCRHRDRHTTAARSGH